jgi:hypothetical protein
MKIAVVTILTSSPWSIEARAEDARIGLMAAIVNRARGAELVVFPAGFLVCGSSRARNRIARRVRNLLRTCACAVAWGIDVRQVSDRGKAGNKGEGADDSARDPHLNWYAYLLDGAGGFVMSNARQLGYMSSQSVDVARVPDDRVLRIGGLNVGVLICGEMLTSVYGKGRDIDKLRDALDCSDVIVDVAHANLPIRGFTRWSRAIQATARNAVSGVVLVAQHLHRENLALRKFSTRGSPPQLASRAGRHCCQRRAASSWRKSFETDSERKRAERERAADEARKTAMLREAVARWKEAREVLEFVGDVRSGLWGCSEVTSDAGLDWAEQYAASLDPAHGRPTSGHVVHPTAAPRAVVVGGSEATGLTATGWSLKTSAVQGAGSPAA